jgi:hypothetical protein
MHILRAHEQKHRCEALYVQGGTIDAAECLLGIADNVSDAVRDNELIMDWLAGESLGRALKESIQFTPSEFTNRCTSTLEIIGDEASTAEKHDDALAAFSTALSLCPSTPSTVLIKWAKTMLIHGSANEALGASTKVCFR